MSKAVPGFDGSPGGIDMASYPTAQKLAARSLEFLREIKDLSVVSPLPCRLDLNH